MTMSYLEKIEHKINGYTPRTMNTSILKFFKNKIVFIRLLTASKAFVCIEIILFMISTIISEKNLFLIL